MGDKVNCKAWGVKTLVLVFPFAVGVQAASDYSSVSRGLGCAAFCSCTSTILVSKNEKSSEEMPMEQDESGLA